MSQNLFNTAFKIGLNYAVNKGLDSLGVNPIISNIVSSFVTGGIQGGVTAKGFTLSTNFFTSFKTTLFAASQTLLASANLNPTLTSLLSITSGNLIDGAWKGNIGTLAVNIASQFTNIKGSSLSLTTSNSR